MTISAYSSVPFIPGLELNRRYYEEAVAPIINKILPELNYTAALIGYGSDVLGMDTPMSRDHMWGPRLSIFLPEDDFAETSGQINHVLRNHLPVSFCGYPTHFTQPDNNGVRQLKVVEKGPVDHLITFQTIDDFLLADLGITGGKKILIEDWLTFPQQKLLAVTGGQAYFDGLNIKQVQDRLAYYPDDIWKYLMACQWMRISQEEPFVGRTGLVGDDLGSRIIASRLVQDVMQLGYLQERNYAPYSKWFGSGFNRLKIAKKVLPYLQKVLFSETWQEREQNLGLAYLEMANNHNQLGVCAVINPTLSNFHDRPFQVIHAEMFANSLQASIADRKIRDLALYGAVNQFCTTTDILESPEAVRRLRVLYH
jgi:hypothetical protein